jgi:hypothetical protein
MRAVVFDTFGEPLDPLGAERTLEHDGAIALEGLDIGAADHHPIMPRLITAEAACGLKPSGNRSAGARIVLGACRSPWHLRIRHCAPVTGWRWRFRV